MNHFYINTNGTSEQKETRKQKLWDIGTHFFFSPVDGGDFIMRRRIQVTFA